jgi:hypothetical protein
LQRWDFSNWTFVFRTYVASFRTGLTLKPGNSSGSTQKFLRTVSFERSGMRRSGARTWTSTISVQCMLANTVIFMLTSWRA